MRVLQFGKFYPFIGGVNKVLFDLSKGLNANGIKCDVLCASVNKKDYKLKLNDADVFVASSWLMLSSTLISPSMIRKLKEIACQYDIIHIHHPDPMAALALFFSNTQAKIILHWHSDIVRQKVLLRFYSPLQDWLLKRSDLIFVTTPNYASHSKYLKKYISKIRVVPIGIDPDELKTTEALSLDLKQKYKNKKIIFSLGRFCYYKGFEYLIESAKYLDDNYIIIIGGDGYLRHKYEKIIARYRLQSKVILPGKLSEYEKANYLIACDVFCLSSIEKSEAFGIVQIEAMCKGRPVVATMIEGSGVDWVNQDGVSGLNVIPRNPNELAKAFELIINDEMLHKKLSNGAKERFTNEFTLEKMTNKCIDFYMSVL